MTEVSLVDIKITVHRNMYVYQGSVVPGARVHSAGLFLVGSPVIGYVNIPARITLSSRSQIHCE